MLREYELRFHAMGTDVTLLAVDRRGSRATPALLGAAQALFDREEARFSRFQPESELSRLNRDGALSDPSDEMWDVLLRSREWRCRTGGDFDPTVLHALERAGYDRTFSEVVTRAHGDARPTAHAGSFERVVMEETDGRRTVRLLDGARIDLGGIVKGWTVDRAAELLAPVGRFIVDAGGDIAARGDSLESEGWCVGVEDPLHPERDLDCLLLIDGAVATSSVARRRWRAGGGWAHHLIDPRTMAPAETDAVSVTVLGPTAESSEVWAKSALLRGVRAGLDLLHNEPGLRALLAAGDGTAVFTPGWPSLFPAPYPSFAASSMGPSVDSRRA